MCLGDAVELIVTDGERFAGEQDHPGSQKWTVVLQTSYSFSL